MRTPVVTFLLSIVLLSLLSNHISSALFCFRCLRLECKGTENVCEDVRSFILLHLREYYHFENGYVRPCELDPEDLVEWRVEETYEKPCENSPHTATCTAGRLQVKSYPGGDSPVLISHATIIGCGKDQLIRNIQKAVEKTQCDLIRANGTGPFSGQIFHKMQVEHCSKPGTLCRDKDFCVGPEESVVKEFNNVDRTAAMFDYGLIIGIIAFIVVIFAAVIAASLCSFPVNRASNTTPLSSKGKENGIGIEDNADLIGVRTNSDSSGRGSSGIGSRRGSGGNEIEEDLSKAYRVKLVGLARN